MSSQYIPPQSGSPSAKTPLLPLWATVKSAYSLAWGYRAEYLKISWCWLLLATPIMCLYSWSVWPSMEAVICIDYTHLPNKVQMDADSRSMFIASIPMNLFALLFGASIAVAWHRLILRHEKITSLRYLRSDSVVLDYFIFGFFLLLLSSLTSVISLAFPMISGSLGLMAVAGILLTIPAIRLPIILPAKALERKDITLKAVWQKTSWNYWRLFWGVLLCALPGAPVFLIMKAGCGSNITGPLMYGASLLFSAFVLMPTELAFLSLSYQHFFERENQTGNQELQKTPESPTYVKVIKRILLALLLVFILGISAFAYIMHNYGDELLANAHKRAMSTHAAEQ